MKVLYNDWPYGLEPEIVHLVVWTKFGLDEDPDTGDLTAEMRRQIDEYVDRTFRSRVPPDQVCAAGAYWGGVQRFQCSPNHLRRSFGSRTGDRSSRSMPSSISM